jgi:hypothetical protein
MCSWCLGQSDIEDIVENSSFPQTRTRFRVYGSAGMAAVRPVYVTRRCENNLTVSYNLI